MSKNDTIATQVQASLLAEILPIPSDRQVTNRFDLDADVAFCAPSGECAGKCDGFA